MQEAIHPYSSNLISYTDYVQFALDKGYQKTNDAPSTKCPVCNRNMKVRGGQKKDDGHFYHNDSLFCPTKKPSARPYLGLTPTVPDINAMKINKQFVIDNLEKIWKKLNSIIPFLHINEFIEILKEAKKLNVYGYSNLNPQRLPYIFVTLINFLPSKSKKKERKLKFCFFYESTIQTYEELWINQGYFSKLVRISYKNSETKRVKIISTDINYLDENGYELYDSYRQKCLAHLT
ncbi:MAG: hypothetical protein AB7D38_04460 [Sulfurimonas sp.]|uniref:hypothetical protein n=1 Tax=Sulfurimonas sp. TaxID=2022749 RepID=UPI003D108049